MDKKELLEKAIKKGSQFRGYNYEDLLMIGDFIGRNPVFFKSLYKAHRKKDPFA